MPSYENTHFMPYTTEQMYALVADVRHYPLFLPWCREAVIHHQTAEEMVADLVVGEGPFEGRFQSRVHFSPPSKIDVVYQEGPLKHLQNSWKFDPVFQADVEVGCRVYFFIDFAFQNGLFNMLMGHFFEKATRRMMGAFEMRAKELYNPGAPSKPAESPCL